MSHVLVTGAGGYIGSQVVEYLASRGHRVSGTWRRDRSRLDTIRCDKSELTQVDLANAPAVSRLVRPGAFDVIVHAAAAVGGSETLDRLRTHTTDNVQATANLVSAALEARCRRLIFCSTISVYGGAGHNPDVYRETDARPASIYGWSKLAGEQLLTLAAGLDAHFEGVSLRLAGVHGRGRTTGALHTIASAAKSGHPIVLNNPENRFRWLLIDDLLASIDTLLTAPLPPGHHVCNLASADDFTLAEIAQRICVLCSSNSAIETSGTSTRNEVMSIERALALWGYTPTRLDTFLPSYLKSLPTGA